MSENITYINQSEWKQTVLESETPVVVDFYSTECPPCEALATKFEPLAELYGDHIRFIKIFRQENRELSTSLGVNGSPTVLFYKDGRQVGDVLAGGIKRAELVHNLDQLIDKETADACKARARQFTTDVDLAILGGGPAGLTAAIYAAQAKLNTMVIDTAMPGGNVSVTHLVSNYPGFDKPQNGYMLSHFMTEQAKGAGAKFRQAVDITSVDLNQKRIVIDELETINAKKIILATGSRPRTLDIAGEKEYMGKGVSYCATCDGKYFEGKHAVVIGGGNSAVEEALFIEKFAAKITMVHQFDQFQANKESVRKLLDSPKVEVLWNHEPRAFIAKQSSSVNTVQVENLKSKELSEIACDGVFVFVGMVPNLEMFKEPLKKDEWGYLIVDESMHTSMPDVFSAGDANHKLYRQITTAVADGTIAAIAAAKELES